MSEFNHFRDFYRLVSYFLSYRIVSLLYLVWSISTITYMTSFDSVIFIANFVIYFVSLVMDDISPTSSSDVDLGC